jgi:uncharacterized protein with HEPN domain
MGNRQRSLEALVTDIKIWIHRGRINSAGIAAKSFEGNSSLFDAGNWAVLCVGEAAGKILKYYPEFGDLELRKQLTAAYATRNRIAHGYYDLDAEQIWETLEYSFPELVTALETCLKVDKSDGQ